MITFFGIIFGLFAVGTAAPNFQAINEGKSAGKLTFEIIDRTPEIKLDDGKQIDPNGEIEFKNVNFYYPAKPEQLILKNFSCKIEAGKTTAIVGPSGSGKSTII